VLATYLKSFNAPNVCVIPSHNPSLPVHTSNVFEHIFLIIEYEGGLISLVIEDIMLVIGPSANEL
jgi:hypothetical protein